MTTFDAREQVFESKHGFDSQTDFRIRARRDRLLAAWAASQIGLRGEAADTYIQDVVCLELNPGAEDAVVQKVLTDLVANGIDMTDYRLRRQLHYFSLSAKDYILANPAA